MTRGCAVGAGRSRSQPTDGRAEPSRLRRSGGVSRAVGLVGAGLVALVALGGPGAEAAAAQVEGAWSWPVLGPRDVGRPFAPPAERYGAGHRGADLPAGPGSPVLAAGAGRVSYAGLLAGRGVVVVVHGELRTTYEPVTAKVDVGQEVAAGQVVGLLDPRHAGCLAAACLHWGLRRGEDYLDPVRLVDRGPLRLLPLGALAPRSAGPVGGPLRAPAEQEAAGPVADVALRPAGAGPAAEAAEAGSAAEAEAEAGSAPTPDGPGAARGESASAAGETISASGPAVARRRPTGDEAADRSLRASGEKPVGDRVPPGAASQVLAMSTVVGAGLLAARRARTSARGAGP